MTFVIWTTKEIQPERALECVAAFLPNFSSFRPLDRSFGFVPQFRTSFPSNPDLFLLYKQQQNPLEVASGMAKVLGR